MPDSRKPEVRFGDDIETDLSRRDFTVNAMALSLPELELVDPFDGIADLSRDGYAHLSTPRCRSQMTPYGMLRGRAGSSAGYQLVPDPSPGDRRQVDAVTSRDRLQGADPRRTGQAATLPVRRQGLWFLVDTGLRPEFLPELPALALSRIPIQRHKDVLAHTIAVVEKTRPGPDLASRGAVPRRRQALDQVDHGPVGSISTTTTSSGRRWRESA